ncbi:phosphohistidine phosphatase [Quadrisphaera granulorum]|uniref:Phosphohistidine phosphatase n=1 Tax=Quadrisphaera granulorum TaxID=317664 RepID=A0A315ZYE5_9ACTN|nr:histidine phosphatase family protein [Quadrisphaera granulorum]PWJ50681.1 phosphohistidine phosphatase [Quadrisphaera granulorum]SZE97929.1 phosphohistidine phosphatase [Quadrisphaera granulorum]
MSGATGGPDGTAGPLHRLVLVRHGKAVADSADGSDHSRALAPRGASQAAATAAWLVERGLGSPDLVLVSSAVRTAQTWQVMAPLLHPGTVREEPELYETSAEALVHLVAATPEEVAVLALVGHEPVVSGAASALAGEGSDGRLAAQVLAGVSTGSAVVLELDHPWAELQQGTARLVALYTP